MLAPTPHAYPHFYPHSGAGLCRTGRDMSRHPTGLHRGKLDFPGRTGTSWDGSWRRGWDSNPRYACAYSGFRDRHVQPLRHLSGRAGFYQRGGSTRRFDGLESAHIRLQRHRDVHAAICALIVLHDRDQGAPDGKARTVQRMYQLGLPLLVSEARLHTPRLECFKVAARRDLTVSILPGEPDLDIVGLGRGEAGVTGAKRDDAVRQLELFQDRLGMS